MGLFLAAHGLGDVLVRVVEARLLDYLATVQKHVFLTGNLVGNGAAHVAEGVHVLELSAGAELFLAPGPDGNVGVTAEASLFHVAVAHPKIGHDAVESLQIGNSLLRRAHVRFGDDFHQGRACPVQIHVAVVLGVGVDVLARVVFHVDAGNANFLRAIAHIYHHIPVLAQGKFELGNLVACRKIRVEIVLSGKDAVQIDGTVGGKPHQGGVVHGLFVDARQCAGHASAHLAGIGVGRLAKGVGAGTEELGGCGQLHMDLKADYSFKIGHVFLRTVYICG